MLRLALASFVLVAPLPASAGCMSLITSMCPKDAQVRTSTARFIKVPVRPPAFAVGDVFPVGEHFLLMNPARFGLPPVDGAWRYYHVAPDVFRVDTNTGRVLEVVSDGNRRMMR